MLYSGFSQAGLYEGFACKAHQGQHKYNVFSSCDFRWLAILLFYFLGLEYRVALRKLLSCYIFLLRWVANFKLVLLSSNLLIAKQKE